jgi:biopolymer transport protein TolR
MGASLPAGGHGGGRRGRRSRRMPMSEINVTPLVDVMLVLLIVFMVAAPMMTVGVPVDLPKTKGTASKSEKEVLTVTVKPDGKIYLMEEQVTLSEVGQRLRAIAKEGEDQAVSVRGDKTSNYGELLRVMGRIRDAGFTKISLTGEMEQEGER